MEGRPGLRAGTSGSKHCCCPLLAVEASQAISLSGASVSSSVEGGHTACLQAGMMMEDGAGAAAAGGCRVRDTYQPASRCSFCMQLGF